MTVRPLSWACGHVTEMLLILKKLLATWLFARKSYLSPSREVSHDFVRGQCVAENWGYRILGHGSRLATQFLKSRFIYVVFMWAANLKSYLSALSCLSGQQITWMKGEALERTSPGYHTVWLQQGLYKRWRASLANPGPQSNLSLFESEAVCRYLKIILQDRCLSERVNNPKEENKPFTQRWAAMRSSSLYRAYRLILSHWAHDFVATLN